MLPSALGNCDFIFSAVCYRYGRCSCKSHSTYPKGPHFLVVEFVYMYIEKKYARACLLVLKSLFVRMLLLCLLPRKITVKIL